MSSAAIIQWIVLLAVSFVLAVTVRRRVVAFVPPIGGLVLLALQSGEPPAWKLLAASLLFLYLMKAAVLLTSGTQMKLVAALAYWTVWPGMDPEPLARIKEPGEQTGKGFIRGLLCAYTGLAVAFVLALFQATINAELLSWLGIAALLLVLHLGFGGVLSALMQLAGWPVKPLFDRPLASTSLRDFWTKRWNRPFVEMDRILFLEPLRRRFGLKGAMFGIFLISGLLHEMAISYPAGAGWGLPLIYFALQGAGVLAEAKWKVSGPIWTWAWLLVPLPLLFHPAFRHTFIVPLFEWLHAILVGRSFAEWMNLLLWVLGIAHFSVLMASFQVPFRLHWREELPRLSSFNRKLVWTLGGFTTMTITAFGTLTLVLHRQLLQGEFSALCIAVYILCFWCVRLLTDAFYYRHSDWPEGQQFVVGHALLNSLFSFLVLGYGTLLAWHAFF